MKMMKSLQLMDDLLLQRTMKARLVLSLVLKFFDNTALLLLHHFWYDHIAIPC